MYHSFHCPLPQGTNGCSRRGGDCRHQRGVCPLFGTDEAQGDRRESHRRPTEDDRRTASANAGMPHFWKTSTCLSGPSVAHVPRRHADSDWNRWQTCCGCSANLIPRRLPRGLSGARWRTSGRPSPVRRTSSPNASAKMNRCATVSATSSQGRPSSPPRP